MASVKQQPEGGVVHSPAPWSPRPVQRRWRQPLAIGLGLLAWPLLAFFVLAAPFFLVGLALPPAILRSPPTAEALIITAGRTVREDRRPGRLLGRGGDGYCEQVHVNPSWLAVPSGHVTSGPCARPRSSGQ